MKTYIVEVTDTFGGEPNYTWRRIHGVSANSFLGAVRAFSRRSGYKLRFVYDDGEAMRYDAKGGNVCVFITESDVHEAYNSKI